LLYQWGDFLLDFGGVVEFRSVLVVDIYFPLPSEQHVADYGEIEMKVFKLKVDSDEEVTVVPSILPELPVPTIAKLKALLLEVVEKHYRPDDLSRFSAEIARESEQFIRVNRDSSEEVRDTKTVGRVKIEFILA